MHRVIKNSLYCFGVLFLVGSYLNAGMQIFFSPDDKLAIHLGALLDNAHHKIHAAIYMFTDKSLAQKLIHAKNRGVDVQIVTDKSCLNLPSNKIELLKKHNIDVFIFPSVTHGTHATGHNSNIMHNKFAIIDKTVWSGSYNWTRSAHYKNQENVIVCDEKRLCNRYEQQFELLKQRCTSLKSKKCRVKKNKHASLPHPFASRLRKKFMHGLQRLRGAQ